MRTANASASAGVSVYSLPSLAGLAQSDIATSGWPSRTIIRPGANSYTDRVMLTHVNGRATGGARV
jgi:hypothetical protein